MSLGLIAASVLLASGLPQCPMRPPPLAVEAFESSKEVRAFVVDGPNSASLLLKDGSVMRVMSMACVDSGAVAKILIPKPPPATDISSWRKLTARLAYCKRRRRSAVRNQYRGNDVFHG